ncbi:hypothetical protein HPP92_006420 [Vanilla planifolia]|uniref:Phytocyanin domain-containing protein n=1 Tax=Vanilla planifolia TaxID=51239 RepID=A0A835RWG8_VANPL|nr:hypothetical protein HPP92_006420 [Vanilla planifolia]
MAGVRGGERNMQLFIATAALVASLVMTWPVASVATTYPVGDSMGWTAPPNSSFYEEWSATKVFVAGDVLVFKFRTGLHNVIEVNSSNFKACSTENPIGPKWTTGPAFVKLTPGERYYICGFPGHCHKGQKLSVLVAVSGAPAPSPTTVE